MTVTAQAPAPPRTRTAPDVQAAPPAPPPASSRRRGFTPLTPMRVQAAKSMTKLADHMKETHPDMLAHQHVRDAARMLRSGNEEAAQRHLRAAMFAMTPQSLMRNGLHTDDDHIAARDAMHGIHRHLLLTKDIADTAAKNQANLRRDSYGDDSSSPPMPQPPAHDPNAGYGPGANAQKPTARQPGGDRALNAPARTNSGGSDPAVADPVGPQPRGSKQFSYGWDEVSSVIGQASRSGVIDLVGPKGYIHGWIFVGVPAPGDKVSIPGHGPGKVVSGNAKHARVKLASGHVASIAHDGDAGKPGKLTKSASAPPAPKEDEADYVAANRKQANAAIAKGETLFHGTKAEFKPGDIIDAQHARAGVTRLHEGKQYAFASSDPGEATFAGGAGDSKGTGHVYRVEPVGKYEFDPHQGSATSRRTTGGFRVVEEVKKWSGGKMDKPFSYKAMTPAQKKAYASKGTVPAGMAPPPGRAQQHARESTMTTDLAHLGAYGWDDLLRVLEMASSGGHHIAGTPDTYVHGWKLRSIGGGKTELYDKLPAADKMGVAALKAHMSKHHASGINIGGRRVGKKNPSKEDLLAVHEAMHANEPLSVNPPGTADRSALKGGYSRISQAHTHGNVTGMANRRPGIELSAKTAALEVTPAPYGKPGGPGLYGVHGLEHTPYYQQVVKALRGRGMDKGRASAVAYGALRKWAAGGGNVHPEVQAAAVTALAGEKAIGAAAKAVHGHANSWDEVADRVTELAASPAQPRVPAGQAGGGQFGSGGQAQQQQQAGAKSIASQTASKNVKAKIAANQQAKNKLLTQAAGYRAQADKLIAQRKVLQAELASASGATSSGQSGSTTSAGSSTTSSGSSTTASTAPATTSTAASTTPASMASTTASTSTALTSAQTAQINAQIGQLTTQIVAYQKQYAQAMAQAAKL